MSDSKSNHGYYEDPGSGGYDRISKAYANLWHGHQPDARHYLNIRKAYATWLLQLRDEKLKPENGSVLILGPGFDIAGYKELDPVSIHAHLADHPRIVVADFSREILRDAYSSIKLASGRVDEDKMRLVRRDFSGGLSAKFESMIVNRINAIESADQFIAFMGWLESKCNNIIDNIRSQEVETGDSRQGRSDVIEVGSEQGLCFKNIVRGTEDIRFMIANGVFSGSFYTTENVFRDKLMSFARSNPEEITIDKVREFMHLWHDIITELTNEIIVNGLSEFSKAHPEARSFVTLDKSALYTDLDSYPRIDIDDIKVKLLENGLSATVADEWISDDSSEIPPHKHNIVALNVKPKNIGDGDRSQD